MGSNWKTASLGEIGTVVGGATPSTKKASNWDGGIPWISPKDLTGYRYRYIKRGERNITDEGLSSCSTTLLPPGTVLFSSRAPIGYIAIASNPICTNQGFKSVIPDNEIDPLFLYYLLLYNKNRIESLGSGTTFKEVSGTVMKQVTVSYPESLTEQKAIATVLDCVDSKIEINQHTNDYLSQFVTIQFRSLFGDLFSGTGKGRIGDYLRLERGLSYKGKFLAEQGVPMLNLGNILPGSIFREEKLKYYIGDYKESNKVHYHDILIANTDLTQAREVIGSAILVPRFEDEAIYSHHLSAVRDSGLPTYFLFEALKTPFFRSRAAGFATGTTVLALPKDAITDMPFDLPKEEEMRQFEEWATPWVLLQEEYRTQSKKLSQLRDALLPKLMSGEIDVSEVELTTQPNNHLSDG